MRLFKKGQSDMFSNKKNTRLATHQQGLKNGEVLPHIRTHNNSRPSLQNQDIDDDTKGMLEKLLGRGAQVNVNVQVNNYKTYNNQTYHNNHRHVHYGDTSEHERAGGGLLDMLKGFCYGLFFFFILFIAFRILLA